jgi:guanosine-3',5'-bis(diphosphate) 3'-pyrophosphohydrolase
MGTALGSRPARTNTTRQFDAALVLAKRAHRGQRREPGGAPYLEHVWEVSALLRLAQMPDDIVIAGLLHDSVERGDVQLEEITAGFGERVSRAVAALTEDDGIETYETRKAALRDQVASAGPGAAAVFAADKVSSARNIRRVVNGRSDGLERIASDLRRKFSHYEQSLVMLERIVPRLRLVRELRQELISLRSELRQRGIIES